MTFLFISIIFTTLNLIIFRANLKRIYGLLLIAIYVAFLVFVVLSETGILVWLWDTYLFHYLLLPVFIQHGYAHKLIIHGYTSAYYTNTTQLSSNRGCVLEKIHYFPFLNNLVLTVICLHLLRSKVDIFIKLESYLERKRSVEYDMNNTSE